jgi:ABC-type methionine transport system ATPase subunit
MAQVDVTLSAGREQVGEPWIWKLSREFNVRVNIKKASVDGDFGVMLLELDGPGEEIQRATSWLMTTGLRVEALTRALGA